MEEQVTRRSRQHLYYGIFFKTVTWHGIQAACSQS